MSIRQATLKRYDVDVPNGLVVFSAQEGIDLQEELPKFPLVLKAQIHSGGREAVE